MFWLLRLRLQSTSRICCGLFCGAWQHGICGAGAPIVVDGYQCGGREQADARNRERYGAGRDRSTQGCQFALELSYGVAMFQCLRSRHTGAHESGLVCAIPTMNGKDVLGKIDSDGDNGGYGFPFQRKRVSELKNRWSFSPNHTIAENHKPRGMWIAWGGRARHIRQASTA